MEFPMTAQEQAAISQQYYNNISRYPTAQKEVDTFLADQEPRLALCLRYLYGHMAAQDVLSFPVEMFAGYVEATLQAWDSIDYCRTIPPEIFLPYVLYHRVNSECLDGSRSFLMQALLPHVQGKSLEQAALAVNYWCYAHATYTPADDRTLGPLPLLGLKKEQVASLRLLDSGKPVSISTSWVHSDYPEILFADLGPNPVLPDPVDTVLEVTLKG